MTDPDSFAAEEDRMPRYYWAVLAWAALLCLVIGLTAYALCGA